MYSYPVPHAPKKNHKVNSDQTENYNSLSEEEKLEFTEDGTLSYEDIPDGTDESGFDIPTDLLEKVIAEVPF